MASTSSLEFLGSTLSGELMGVSCPGCFLAFLSGGGGAGCCGVGLLMLGDCSCPVDWPEGSCDCAAAAPARRSAAATAVKKRGEGVVITGLPRLILHPSAPIPRRM